MEEERLLSIEFMGVFAEFGRMKGTDPYSEEAQAQVKRLQDYITEHYYTCSEKILCDLGRMYVAGGSMTQNIDRAGGEGTAEFVCRAIEVYCGR